MSPGYVLPAVWRQLAKYFSLELTCTCVYDDMCTLKALLHTNTYLDLEWERDLDLEHLEAPDGLGPPDRLSDLTRAGLPPSDLDEERESCFHSNTLTILTWILNKRMTVFTHRVVAQCV